MAFNSPECHAVYRQNERFSAKYGFFRPYVHRVIYRYLNCGILHNGFARVKCKDCNHEYLLPSPVNAATSVPRATRKEWSSSGSGSARTHLTPHHHLRFTLPSGLVRAKAWTLDGPFRTTVERLLQNVLLLPGRPSRPLRRYPHPRRYRYKAHSGDCSGCRRPG
ncbi:MAG: hypothetical protein CVU57_24440 [Deltaproteobacteria bacterium HGW-Deltaproteobacteria-15]|nr:MAG: hypothetical protein CVU57_24440 [Deltaproteobacteria bacterium HGW-Deltaproteobacteria-15]